MDTQKEDGKQTRLPPCVLLPLPSSLCPCPSRLLCFPFLQGPSWLFRKFSIRELMLNSAGMSNRDLGRERPRIELNSHPGLPCGGGYKDITQSPGKVLWLEQNLGAGMGRGEPCVLIYSLWGPWWGWGFSHWVGIVPT